VVEQSRRYCVNACPDCPVAHIADGGIAVTNTYAEFGDAIGAETQAMKERPTGIEDPDNKAEFLEVARAAALGSLAPDLVAEAILRIETGQCPTAPREQN